MQRLKDLAISDTGFVFDPFSGASYTVNDAARCILDGLKHGLRRADLEALLRHNFDVDGADLTRDIDELVHSLRLFGLVPGGFEVRA